MVNEAADDFKDGAAVNTPRARLLERLQGIGTAEVR